LFENWQNDQRRAIFAPYKARRRRHTLCISRRSNDVWHKKGRRLGVLTIFKQALVTQIQSVPNYDPEQSLCFVGSPSDPALQTVSTFTHHTGKGLVGTDSQAMIVGNGLYFE